MPSQTRSRAAAAASSTRKGDQGRRQEGESSDAKEQPPHKSAALGEATNTDDRYESPDGKPPARATATSASRLRPPSSPQGSARRQYQERERRQMYRQPVPGSQEHFFSPPPYKVRSCLLRCIAFCVWGIALDWHLHSGWFV